MPPALDAPNRLASVVAREPIHGGGTDQACGGQDAVGPRRGARVSRKQPRGEGLRGVREHGEQEGEGATTAGRV